MLESVLFILCFVGFVFPAYGDQNEGMPDTDFAKLIDGKNTLVDFYAPWCGHCKKLLPIWEQVSLEINTIGKPAVQVIKIDCTTNSNSMVCDKYSITGYPTIMLITADGSTERYNGGRTFKKIIKWARSKDLLLEEGERRPLQKNKDKSDNKNQDMNSLEFAKDFVKKFSTEYWKITAMLIFIMGFLCGLVAGVTIALKGEKYHQD